MNVYSFLVRDFSRPQRFLVAQIVGFYLLMSVGALMKNSVVGSYGMNDLCLWNVFWVNYFRALSSVPFMSGLYQKCIDKPCHLLLVVTAIGLFS